MTREDLFASDFPFCFHFVDEVEMICDVLSVSICVFEVAHIPFDMETVVHRE